MDDFVLSNLHEARNEWCSRLVSIFTPLITDGIKSIFNESWKLCIETDEASKYLMTFQNLLTRIPKWNSVIIEEERKRIVQRSGCNYLEELISCVHIIQLKVLTSIRVGNKQKKIDISIPKLDSFIHKVYIHVARKVYSNVYLFEKNMSSLSTQKNMRELEIIVQECILTSIRDSIPTEEIIRAYMDESVEHEEEVVIENIEEPTLQNDSYDNKLGEVNNESENNESENNESEEKHSNTPLIVPSISDLNDSSVITKLKFNDYDSTYDENNNIDTISAPKTIERLEEISNERAIQRKLEEEGDDFDDRIKIHTDSIPLDGFEQLDKSDDYISLDDIEELN
jgi:hypothetical protein